VEHLRLHTGQRGSLGRERREGGLLVVEAPRVLAQLPGVTPRSPPRMGQPPARLKRVLEEAVLLPVGVLAVGDRLTQECMAC
jgi:hypothetical protein